MSNSAGDTKTLVVERVYAHSPEKLWRALTESTLLAEWLMKNDFQLETGRRFEFRSEPMPNWDGVIACEVQVIVPQRQLAYSWCALGLDSVVLWTLTPVAGGTQLRMEQSGFREDQEMAYKGATYGWRRFFDGLEKLLGGGAA